MRGGAEALPENTLDQIITDPQRGDNFYDSFLRMSTIVIARKPEEVYFAQKTSGDYGLFSRSLAEFQEYIRSRKQSIINPQKGNKGLAAGHLSEDAAKKWEASAPD